MMSTEMVVNVGTVNDLTTGVLISCGSKLFTTSVDQ